MNTEALNRQLKQEIDALHEEIASLKESEERYRLISSVTTDYTFSTKVLPDGSLDLNWVAGAFESISGYSVEEFKARGAWRTSIHPDDLHIDDNDIARLRNNQDTESQIRTINRNGEIVWVQVFAHPIWDNKKNCLSGIYGAVKNITDRKNAEKKLINSEIRFRELLEKVNLITVILDTEGRVMFCNQHLLKLTDYKQEEIIGRDWFDLMIPGNSPEVKQLFINGLVIGNISPRFENPILTKSGKKLDIVWSNVVQRNHEGQIMGIASIGEDITERKLAENNLHETNERLKLMLEDTPTAIWDWNLETDVWHTTSKYYTMLGYEPESGMSDREVWLNRIHPDDRENVARKINCVLSLQDLEYSYTARMQHANGTYRWQTVIGHIIEKDESGKAKRMLGVRIDVDETKKAEEALRKLNIELEQKITERTLELENRSRTLEEKEIVLTNTIKNLNLKSEELQNSTLQLQTTNKELEAFSYSVSHDLRAPLRAINGFVNILNEEYSGLLDDEGKRICSIIHSNAVKMGQLIDDLLSFSRLIRSELQHSVIDMHSVVHNLIAEFHSSKELNPNIISLHKLPSSTGDTNLIKQVWLNLISNAIKYSSKTTNPQIIIGATQDDNETVYFIKDNGVGFNMNYSHKLFGVFQRLHGTNEFEGTGVGLAIVQRIVTRHGGRVWAESEIGKGATFYFALPINKTGN
jgi:PAS domain S-box-containing protein